MCSICCLAVQMFAHACGDFKKKKMEKKYCEINKGCQKSTGFFVQNIFFRQTVFSL